MNLLSYINLNTIIKEDTFFSDPSKVVSGHVFFFFKKIAFMSL